MSELKITVPCGSCSAGVGFGDLRCRTCGAGVPRELHAALEARLAASSADYRELIRSLTIARIALLVCAIGQLGYGALLSWFANRGVETQVAGTTPLVEYVAGTFIALVLFACFAFSGRNPMLSLSVALATWTISHLLPWRLGVLFSKPGIVVAVGISVLLLRGLRAARRAAAMRAALSQ